MPTHIRSSEQFELDSHRGFGHTKSPELRDVIRKLSLYHANTYLSITLREHLLIDLRDSLIRWSTKDPREFAARHGPELAHEVMVELASSHAEHLKLVDGDILFRWVPKGFGQVKIQDKVEQNVITMGQAVQETVHGRFLGQGFNLQVSALVVKHVGIYVGGVVVEIGGGGLDRKPVAQREHYDLVVRSRAYGPRIAMVARSALCGPKYYQRLDIMKYPVWDLLTVAALPYGGTRLLARDRLLLDVHDRENREAGRSNVLQQRVICSHFVNAVLYAAVGNGTLATATDHAFDDVFKVSPAQMWCEFMSRQGIWAGANAVFVGLQHKGNLDRNIDPSVLGVGLTQPPVPSKAGRPPLPRQPAT